jgi:probable HAF family extracellular repeat protein
MKNHLLISSRAFAAATFIFAATPDSHSCGSGDNATISLLPTLGGMIQPYQMNAAGQIAGYSFTAANAVQAFRYSGGVTTSVGGNGTQGFAINSTGEVAGSTVSSFGSETHAALFSHGTMTDLGTLGGTLSYAVAINDAGQIVGDSTVPGGFAFNAFLYSDGSMTALGDLGGGFGSFSADINNSGTVVGDSFTMFFEDHAFSYVAGTMTDLGTLGGGYSFAVDINDNGTVVGESSLATGETHAFSYADGTMNDLGTLGGTFSTAVSVNASNQVAGYSRVAGDTSTHAFLHSGGVMTDLGTLGGLNSQPAALNNLGHVVGWSDMASGPRHAVLWRNGTATDLNSLLPAGSGWLLNSAEMINEAGRIVGNGSYNGVSSWFVMDLGTGSVNNVPVAVATGPTTVECGNLISLDGSQSSDPDNDTLTYEWSSGGTVFGTNVTLSASAVVGSYTITLKVTDPCGEFSLANVNVNVVDTSAPSIACPGQLELSANASCQATLPDLTSLVTVADGCSAANALTVRQSPVAGTSFGKGSHVVTLTATDASGNSASCTTTILVKDTTSPVIVSAPSAVTVAANTQCEGTVPNVSGSVVANDNCTAANALSVVQSPAAGTLVGSGLHTITVTVADESGNSSATNVALSVVDSTTPAIVSAPSTLNISVDANCEAQVPNVVANVVGSDNCTPANALAITQSPAAGSVVSAGGYVITVTVTDASGNATSKNISLIVADTTAPVVATVCATPDQLTPPNHQMVPVTVSVKATDNCDASPVSEIVSVTANEAILPEDVQITSALTCSLAASKNSAGSERVYTIHIRTRDASGNEATGSANVRVLKSNGNGNGSKGKP